MLKNIKVTQEGHEEGELERFLAILITKQEFKNFTFYFLRKQYSKVYAPPSLKNLWLLFLEHWIESSSEFFCVNI